MSFSIVKTLHIPTLPIPFISIITILVIPILVALSILIVSKPSIVSPTFVSSFSIVSPSWPSFFGCHMMDYCLIVDNFVHVYFVWQVLQILPHWQVCLPSSSTSNHSLHTFPFCRGCKFYVKVWILLSIGLHYDIFDKIFHVNIHHHAPCVLSLFPFSNHHQLIPHLNLHCLTMVEIIYSFEG
jgi:hypothetical protein